MAITSQTNLFLLIGHPVTWSISPQIYNRVFEELSLDVRYLSLDVSPERFAKIFPSLLDSGISGNITAPYKEKALVFLDIPYEEALMTGACNVFWSVDGVSRGDNTDIHGFLNGLPEHVRRELDGSAAVVLGAGGVARSITVALLLEGIERLLVVNRDIERGKDLASLLSSAFPEREIDFAGYDEMARFHGETYPLLINATTVGWKCGEAPPMDPSDISDLRFYFDVVYRGKTTMMEKCESLGVEVIDGLEMLIQQGALSLERWFDVKAPIEIMRRSAQKALEGFRNPC